nr:MAG TPA: hypothetical protein [Caudoviricetes sp.]
MILFVSLYKKIKHIWFLFKKNIKTRIVSLAYEKLKRNYQKKTIGRVWRNINA